jgi:hypothetical protein
MKGSLRKGNILSYNAKVVATSTMMLYIWALTVSKLYDWRVLLEQQNYFNVDDLCKEWAHCMKLSTTKGLRWLLLYAT